MAGLMLGTDKSRGYCLEMICADFLAGGNLESGNSNVLLYSVLRLFNFLRDEEKNSFLDQVAEKASNGPPKLPLRLNPDSYGQLRNQVLRSDRWRCQSCGIMSNLEVHHQRFRSQSGDDSTENLITLCTACHAKIHRR